MLACFLDCLNSRQLNLVTNHLKNRVNARSEKGGLGVVYDVTYSCDMKCIGCAVNAHTYSKYGFIQPNQLETSTEEVIIILQKIRDYIKNRKGINFFLNFGGGEPFLRSDFIDLDQIPSLMHYLHKLEISLYSMHRAMPVGRFSSHIDLLPTPDDYLKLLVSVTEVSEDIGMVTHIHHTIESIYATLIFGHNTYAHKEFGAPDKRSSIGIDPKGNVYFDPWCMAPPWNQLTGGSLLKEKETLESIFNQEILSIVQEYCKPEIRCHGCEKKCSGGSRIASAASYIRLDPSLKLSDVTIGHILSGMTEKDPACPLAGQG